MHKIIAVDDVRRARLLSMRRSRDYLLFALIGLLIAAAFSIFGGFCGIGLGAVLYYPLHRIGYFHQFNLCMIFGSFCGFASFAYLSCNFVIKQHRSINMPGGTLLSIKPQPRAEA